MTSIEDVDINDIKAFLLINGFNITDNKKAYEKAFNLMKNQKTIYDNVPLSIIEWMMAHNLVILKKEIHLYNENEIKNLSDRDRRELANLLGMKTSNIDNIINILKYLHKLIDFSNLPNDTILDIIKNMDINNILSFCNTNKRINKICHEEDLKSIVISKIPDDNFDISKFTLNELFLYSKFINLKKKIVIFDTRIYVHIDDAVYIPYQHTREFNKILIPNNINQIAPYGYYGLDLALLTKNGDILSMNISSEDEINNFFDEDIGLDKIIKIEPVLSGSKSLRILTANGKYYKWDSYDGLKDVAGPPGVIQRAGEYYLTYTGEVYHNRFSNEPFTKIPKLNNIKQITDIGYFLSEEGLIYIIDKYDMSVTFHSDIKNIKQLISEYGSYEKGNRFERHIYMLDINGDVYFKSINDKGEIDLSIPKLYEELKDIVEITGNYILGLVALDKYNRLSVKARDEDIQLYQWEFK